MSWLWNTRAPALVGLLFGARAENGPTGANFPLARDCTGLFSSRASFGFSIPCHYLKPLTNSAACSRHIQLLYQFTTFINHCCSGLSRRRIILPLLPHPLNRADRSPTKNEDSVQYQPTVRCAPFAVLIWRTPCPTEAVTRPWSPDSPPLA